MAERISERCGLYPRTLIRAFLTFLPIRTAAIKASSYSTEAVPCNAPSLSTTSTNLHFALQRLLRPLRKCLAEWGVPYVTRR